MRFPDPQLVALELEHVFGKLGALYERQERFGVEPVTETRFDQTLSIDTAGTHNLYIRVSLLPPYVDEELATE